MKIKVGDVLACELENGCGMEVKVMKPCGCDDCDLVCCGKQMKRKKVTMANCSKRKNRK